MMNIIYKIRCFFRLVLVITLLSSCTSTYEEANTYVSYYDENQEQIKVKGEFYKGRETGEWVFYSKDGKEIKKGCYFDGLQKGAWYYSFSFLQDQLFWAPILSENLEFSLPATFRFHSFIAESNTRIFVDSIDHTTLAISTISSCDNSCVLEYYNSNLNEFVTDKNDVLSSQSTMVDSKMGRFYIDDFDYTRPDYAHVIKEYMAYFPVSKDKLLVITITNQKKHEEYLRFLIGEVFYHFRYNHQRIAFPYEELLTSSTKYK